MTALALALLALVSMSCAPAQAPHMTRISRAEPLPQAEQSSELPELIPASVAPPAPGWMEDVEFLALREAYGARADFADRCEVQEVASRASTALVNRDFDEVVAVTSAPLDRCPVWAQLHLWRMAALRSLGREEEADVHKRWFTGLIQSVLDSGDGKTPETPYVTISISEENAVLARLGLKKQSQALVGSPMLDLVTATNEDGKTVTVYFNPWWHFIRLFHQVSD